MALKTNSVQIVSIILTLIIVELHLLYAFNAGGFWRDEANTLAMAELPSVMSIWHHLEYDSFPMLWFLVLRGFKWIGVSGDLGFRLIGCGIGLGIIAALWINAHLMKFRYPLLSLALIGFSPTLLLWGDSMRAYGFGALLILLVFPMLYKVVTAPSKSVVVLATILSICSVQTLYHNAVIIFAAVMAAAYIAFRNQLWYRVAMLFGIGFISAVSLIPYVSTIYNVKEWSVLFKVTEFTLPLFWERFSMALSAAGYGMHWVWTVLIISAIILTIFLQPFTQGIQKENDGEAAQYCVVFLLICIPSYYCFLWFLSYPTQPWYYVALMVVIAVAVDGALSAFDKKLLGSYARQLIAVSIVFLGFLPMLDAAKTRQTNSDLIAAQLQVSANPGDFILVIPWYYGVSFDRYYTGATPWMTLPIISDHKTHRYDLSKEQMVLKEPLVSIIDAMTNTLKSGNRIYLVGSTIVPPIGKLLTLKPAPSDKHGWNEGAYSYSWMTQVGYFLQNRVTKVEKFNLPDVFHISPYENMGLMVVQGWKKL